MAASNNPWDLDEAALSRFSRRVYVPLPDKNTRALLIKGALKGLQCDISEDEYLRLADKVAHYSGRDLVAVCREAAMQPIRELWGNKLLGGEDGRGEEERASVARQRLVKVIAEQIGRGTPKRRIRRELEAFRRRQVQQCEEEEARYKTKKAKQDPSSSSVIQGQGQGQGQGQSADARGAMESNVKPQGGASSKNFSSTRPGGSSLSSISWLNVDEVMEQAGRLAEEKEQQKKQQAKVKVDPSSSTPQASNPQASNPQASNPQASNPPSPPVTPPLVPSNATSEGLSTRTSSFESERDGEAISASEGNHLDLCCTPRSQAAILQAAKEASFSFATSNSAPDLPLIKNAAAAPQEASTSSQIKSQPKPNLAASQSTSNLKDEGGMGALLSMPANELRPVKYSDFERALAIIMPADFEGLTQKYEEWNGQYGSGADAKRGGTSRHYSTMYI